MEILILTSMVDYRTRLENSTRKKNPEEGTSHNDRRKETKKRQKYKKVNDAKKADVQDQQRGLAYSCGIE